MHTNSFFVDHIKKKKPSSTYVRDDKRPGLLYLLQEYLVNLFINTVFRFSPLFWLQSVLYLDLYITEVNSGGLTFFTQQISLWNIVVIEMV